MKIDLSQFAGFCDGVKRAYDLVMSLDIAKAKKPVFVMGSLVHNEEVIKKIAEKGIERIERADFFAAKSGEIGTIIINAHGAGPDVFLKAKELGADIVDTTCPKVIKVQKLAQLFSEKGYGIVIVGDRDHKEVRGINEWGGGKANVVSKEEDLKNFNFAINEKIAVVAQTTQNEDFFQKIANRISQKYPNAKIFYTTCQTTHSRQSEVKKMAQKNEIMVIIGSQGSANSKRLWEIAKEINPRSYFVEGAGDLQKEWVENAKSAGVTAGASTPDWSIEEVLKKLSEFSQKI